MPSQCVISTVAMALPNTLVTVRPMSRKVSTPSSSAIPSIGSPNWVSVAEITTRLARGTPAMPFDVIISVSSMAICCPADSGML